MISGTMACEKWRGSLWIERISESRRPGFEPDIDNVPHEIFLMACETWRSFWFERISESRRPRFEPDIDNVPHEI